MQTLSRHARLRHGSSTLEFVVGAIGFLLVGSLTLLFLSWGVTRLTVSILAWSGIVALATDLDPSLVGDESIRRGVVSVEGVAIDCPDRRATRFGINVLDARREVVGFEATAASLTDLAFLEGEEMRWMERSCVVRGDVGAVDLLEADGDASARQADAVLRLLQIR